MADDLENIPQEVTDNIDRSMGEEPVAKAPKFEPTYKMMEGSRVAISKQHGKVWKSRRDQAMKVQEDISLCWDEAIDYFENDQTRHRRPGAASDQTIGNDIGNQRLNGNITETHNIVFSNVTTMIPMLYARNPKAEFTADDPLNKDFASMVERLVNTVMAKKTLGGVNLKPKAKRCVTTTLLTNRSWAQVGWVFKEDSSEQAIADLNRLSDALKKAETAQEVQDIEGELMALDQSIGVLQSSGPTLKYRGPKQVLIDPTAEEIDLTDANWAMVYDFLPTSFLNAKFGKKKKGDDDAAEVESIYKPSHILKLGKDTANDGDDNDFSLFEKEGEAASFGYGDEEAFMKAQMTKVWYVFDKTTRRIFLYSDADWEWPIWVWDDPLKLDRFFPLFPLVFFESPKGPNTKGEVTYYLDQQDAINEIFHEKKMWRRWAKQNVIFDKNRTNETDVNAVLKGPDGTARGIDVPEGMKLTDIVTSIPPPSLQFKEVFDVEEYFKSVDRISSVSAVFRGEQFKTNTTNKAVQTNVSAATTRADEKSDAIEDWVGDIAWALAQLCIQFMDKEQVATLIGREAATEWTQKTAQEIASGFSCRVVGGSSKKPTSQAKKDEALQLGQTLGQFASASPSVLPIVLRVMEEAFDEVEVTAADWQKIQSDIAAQQASKSAPAPQQASGVQQAPQAPGQGQPQGATSGGSDIDALLAKMTPVQKAKIVKDIESGKNPQEAIQEVLQGTQPQGQPSTQPQPRAN